MSNTVFSAQRVLNLMARNHDDHVKKHRPNLNDRRGHGGLSRLLTFPIPTIRMATGRPDIQMSLNGKTQRFERDDLLAFAEAAGTKQKAGKPIAPQKSPAKPLAPLARLATAAASLEAMCNALSATFPKASLKATTWINIESGNRRGSQGLQGRRNPDRLSAGHRRSALWQES